jgi:hypothetical protein
VRYEYHLLALGLADHVMVVRLMPALSALPVPAQVGLAVGPTALFAVQGLFLSERLSPRASRVLGLVTGSLYTGLTLALPGTLVLGGELASALGHLVLLLPALLVSWLYLGGAVQDWRDAAAEPPAS